MSAIFAVFLSIGLIMLLAWIGASAASAMVPDGRGWNPDERFGAAGRMVVAAVFGFGMAGISAWYAGLADWLSLAAGTAGAVGLAHVARAFGPLEESEETGEG